MLFSEPKIPQFGLWIGWAVSQITRFQCSSASRKFLNSTALVILSMRHQVSVLFSEPKIPQSAPLTSQARHARPVSVLFSEPKIPQFTPVRYDGQQDTSFQCSSASRKFLNKIRAVHRRIPVLFQCSSASRKFLNPDPRTCVHPYFRPR